MLIGATTLRVAPSSRACARLKIHPGCEANREVARGGAGDGRTQPGYDDHEFQSRRPFDGPHAVRKLGGGLAPLGATTLGAVALAGAIERAGLDPTEIEHAIFGEVLQAGVGQNPARQVVFKAGLAKTVTAETVNKVCASGLVAVVNAMRSINAGAHASSPPAAWSRCRTRRICCATLASAIASVTAR